jgi:hypothetical protein
MTTPAHDTTLAEQQQLDPGIADVVIMLRNLGFNPTDSGDGRSKPDLDRDFDVKHVACTWSPMHEASEPAQDFYDDARKLQKVLGSGWKVQATFDPADDSYILLATKNEEPSSRHSFALAGWPKDTFLWSAQAWNEANARRDSDRIEQLVDAGNRLHEALRHELGRR